MVDFDIVLPRRASCRRALGEVMELEKALGETVIEELESLTPQELIKALLTI